MNIAFLYLAKKRKVASNSMSSCPAGNALPSIQIEDSQEVAFCLHPPLR
jgi:hypothetical protein